jgi:hypothetical protein
LVTGELTHDHQPPGARDGIVRPGRLCPPRRHVGSDRPTLADLLGVTGELGQQCSLRVELETQPVPDRRAR